MVRVIAKVVYLGNVLCYVCHQAREDISELVIDWAYTCTNCLVLVFSLPSTHLVLEEKSMILLTGLWA